MPLSILRIISRESPLAMWQANFIRDLLLDLHQGLTVDILAIKTEADKFMDATLSSLGGKGAFVKELEQALLAGYADIAVHSMKDVTIEMPSQLTLPIIVTREDPRDVFISNDYAALDSLPGGSRLGTSSLRRQCQIKAIRPDLELVDIRGNVGTRLHKLDDAQYDALILAAAGVKRLGFEDRVSEYLGVDVVLPAIGQGAIGIETRIDDSAVLELIRRGIILAVCSKNEEQTARQPFREHNEMILKEDDILAKVMD